MNLFYGTTISLFTVVNVFIYYKIYIIDNKLSELDEQVYTIQKNINISENNDLFAKSCKSNSESESFDFDLVGVEYKFNSFTKTEEKDYSGENNFKELNEKNYSDENNFKELNETNKKSIDSSSFISKLKYPFKKHRKNRKNIKSNKLLSIIK
jgi:hypothetical protein